MHHRPLPSSRSPRRNATRRLLLGRTDWPAVSFPLDSFFVFRPIVSPAWPRRPSMTDAPPAGTRTTRPTGSVPQFASRQPTGASCRKDLSFRVTASESGWSPFTVRTGSGEEAQRIGQLREMPVVITVFVEVFHEWLAETRLAAPSMLIAAYCSPTCPEKGAIR
jgi:hypothetical protein